MSEESKNFDTLVLTDEEGNQTEYVLMDSFMHEGGRFLLVIAKEDIDNDESEAFILREISEDEHEISYELVDDEEELDLFVGLLENMSDDYDIE